MRSARRRLLPPVFVAAWALIAACGDAVTPDLSSDAGGGGDALLSGTDGGDADGSAGCPAEETETHVCLPVRPRSTPDAECPGGVRRAAPGFDGDGICEPAPPLLTDWTCADGWDAVPAFAGEGDEGLAPAGLGQISICRPRLPAGPCPDGTLALPGETDCLPIGSSCPDETESWTDDETLRARAPGFGGTIRFVASGAAEDGDGTRARPWASIETAIAASDPGDILALGIGTWNEEFSIREPIAILGACVSGSRIETRTSGVSATIQVTGDGGPLLRDLTVAGPRPGIHVWASESPTLIESLQILDAAHTGIMVTRGSAQVTIRNVRVSRTESNGDGQMGFGLLVGEESSVRVERATFDGNTTLGVEAEDAGTVIQVLDSLISGTRWQPADRSFGDGVYLVSGAQATLERVAIVNNRDNGLIAGSAPNGENLPTTVVMRDAWVADTEHDRRSGSYGNGITIQQGADATLERVAIANNRVNGIFADGLLESPEMQPTRLSATDVAVLDTRAEENTDNYGFGMVVLAGAQVTATRMVIARNRLSGIIVDSVEALDEEWPSRLALDDSVVSDTRSEAGQGDYGFGIQFRNGGHGTLRRVAISRNVGLGLVVDNEETPPIHASTTVTGSDVSVSDTRPSDSSGHFGVGFIVRDGASVTLSRLRVERSHMYGVFVSSMRAPPGRDPSHATLLDLIVDGVLPHDDLVPLGFGLAWSGGAAGSIERAYVADAFGAGIIVDAWQMPDGSEATRLSLTDASIVDIHEVPSEAGTARGLGIQGGARLDGARIHIERPSTAGLLVDDSAISPAGTHTEVALSDITVLDAHSSETSGRYGQGVSVQSGGRARLDRVHVEDARAAGLNMGIYFGDDPTNPPQLLAFDVIIERTEAQRCASLPLTDEFACPERSFGSGLTVTGGSELDLTRFLIVDSALAGVQLVDAPGVVLRSGRVSGNVVGVNLQGITPPIETAFIDVAVTGNGADVDVTALPIPDSPSGALGGIGGGF